MFNLKGNLLELIKLNCPVEFEATYQPNNGQITIYIDEPIEKHVVKRLQTIIAKYIGDHMLQDSYKTVKIFY